MRLGIIHIGDIHLRNKDGFVGRAQAIADGIAAADPTVHDYLFCISGDVAHAALPDEYLTALAFFRAITAALKLRDAKSTCYFVAVPGNHDCFLPEAGTAVRDALLEGLRKTLDDEYPDIGLLDQVLLANASFYDFERELCGPPPTSDLRVARSMLIDIGTNRVQVSLYNTSLSSRWMERQAQMFMPRRACDRNVTLHQADLCIAVMHHALRLVRS